MNNDHRGNTFHWDNVYEHNVIVNGYVDAAKVAPGIALARANKFANDGREAQLPTGYDPLRTNTT